MSSCSLRRHSTIDLVITTSELCDMIEEAGIDFAHLPDEEPDAVIFSAIAARGRPIVDLLISRQRDMPTLRRNP